LSAASSNVTAFAAYSAVVRERAEVLPIGSHALVVEQLLDDLLLERGFARGADALREGLSHAEDFSVLLSVRDVEELLVAGVGRADVADDLSADCPLEMPSPMIAVPIS
jgi:hypothetical protein